MRDRPGDFGEHELRTALADGWYIDAAAMRYAPVGGGSYHWAVRDTAGTRWFVTADDLDDKAWLGDGRAAARGGLRAAMDTAVALRDDAGLDFVTAPLRSACGDPVRPLGTRYAISVFRFLDGASGRWGQELTAAERGDLLARLAALHGSTPLLAGPPRHEAGLARRDALEAALADLRSNWTGGPFAEPARALLARAQGQVRCVLEVFDDLADRIAAAGGGAVITHGEPHPGNLIWVAGQLMLVDWDTVGLAPPERDLWMIFAGEPAALDGYTEATGRTPDAAALTFYRLRWTLDDISSFVSRLRSSHDRTADAEHALRSLRIAISHAVAAAD